VFFLMVGEDHGGWTGEVIVSTVSGNDHDGWRGGSLFCFAMVWEMIAMTGRWARCFYS